MGYANLGQLEFIKLEHLAETEQMDIAWIMPIYHTNLHFALKALREAGHRSHLICAKRRDGADEVSETHTVVDQEQLTRRDASELMRSLDPDLVIIRKTGRLSKLVYWASVLQRRKVIGYDQRPYLRPRHIGQVLSAPLKGRPIRRFTPVHGLSGRPDPRAAYIPFPVEPMPPGTERCYAPYGVFRILCVGKLTERRKNHFLLLRALEPLAQQFDFRVTVVGSSSLDIGNPDPEYFKALQDYARQGQLAERMEIVTDVPFSEMPTIYRNHDICVLPSCAEPLGTAPLEAMAQGCAAIISSDSGSAYYVQSAAEAGLPCGAIFESGDGDALQLALLKVMSNKPDSHFSGWNAREWVRRSFSPRMFAQHFHDEYSESLLSASHSNR